MRLIDADAIQKRYKHAGKEAQMKNGDAIRQMSDDELADFIERVAAEAISIFVIGNGRRTKTFFAWLDWLKQEMESE